MKANTFRIAAVLFVVLMFARPTLADDALNGARGLLGGNDQASSSEAFAAPREGTAVDYATDEQRESAAAKPIGALGHDSGHDHHAEIDPGARWSTCEPVRFALNTAGAPDGAVDDFKLAIAKMNAASDLDLKVIGTTDAKSFEHWANSVGEKSWRPVLISWGKGGTGILSENASGTATSHAVTNNAGQKVYVSAQIRFNVDHDRLYTPGFGAYGSRTLLYMHEIGHVLGLEHVEDKQQMMYTDVANTVDAGAGDLAGLEKAGNGGCLQTPAP